jgi:hypothetical protein
MRRLSCQWLYNLICRPIEQPRVFPMCVQVQQQVLRYVQRQWSALKLVDAVKTALSTTPFVETGDFLEA